VISFSQVQQLFKSIASAVPDQLDCEGCFALSAQFADAELNGKELSDVLKAVQVHMSQCPCCAYEYQALLEAVRAADSEHGSSNR
jgi:hypothetical protein